MNKNKVPKSSRHTPRYSNVSSDKEDKYKEQKKILNAKLNAIPSPSKFKFLGKLFTVYLIPILLIVICVASAIIIFAWGQAQNMKMEAFGLTIIFLGLSFPFILGCIGFVIFNLIRDISTMKGFIIRKLASNYLHIIFYLPQKRKFERDVILNKDGLSFNYDKGVYIVDSEAIYKGNDNEPVSHYIYNMPNPLKFDFNKPITAQLQNIKDTGDIQMLEGEENKINIIYSSQNLAKFMKDHFLDELHRREQSPMADKISIGLMVIIGILVIAIVILVALLNGNSTSVQAVPPVV